MPKYVDDENGISGNKRFPGVFSRVQQKIKNNLGVIDGNSVARVRKYRSEELHLYDTYCENKQYNHLLNWDAATAAAGEYIAVRKRKPRIIYNIGKVLTERVAAKLVGKSVFPKFVIEDDTEATEFLRYVQRAAEMQPRMIRAVKRMLRSGSSLVRFQVIDGDLKLETYNSKYCYPEFLPNGDLESVRIQYVYEDTKELDENGSPQKKWYRLDLGMDSDVLFDNPNYSPTVEPLFTPVETVTHNLGFVQGEWFRTDEDEGTDGYSLLCDILDMIDELNYGLSQSSQAVSYNHEPLLAISGMDAEELDKIIRSSTKAINLGREGKAAFVESNMKGVEAGNTLRDRVKGKIADVVRVVMLDPEKIVGNAQSGKAMEVLHGPLLELIDELRGPLEKCLKRLLLKMAMTLLELNKRGLETEVTIPAGWKPSSLDVTVTWPKIFPLTIEDLAKMSQVATALAGGNIMSQESMTRWLAPEFGIEDIEEERAKIKAQPVVNPFGSF